MKGPFFKPWLMANDEGFMFAVVAFMERDIVWSKDDGTVSVRDCGVVACSHNKRAWFDNPNLPWDKISLTRGSLGSLTEELAYRKLLVGVFNLAK